MEPGQGGRKHFGGGEYPPPQSPPQSFKKESASSNFKGDTELYEEVGKLAQFLNEMISKIKVAGRMMESVSSEIHLGTDELADVGRKTEEATEKILDGSEKVVDNHVLMSARIKAIRSQIRNEQKEKNNHLDDDFEALECLLAENKATMLDLVGTLSFQDPAGQQLRKVASMLKVFQSRIMKMIVTFGDKELDSESKKDTGEELLSELEYSSEGETIDQNLVDRILKDYGF